MAYKTDMADLLSRLEGLCLGFQAYRHIAKNYLSQSEKLGVLLAEYKQTHKGHISGLFDAANAALQGGQPDSQLIHALLKTLDEVTK